MCKARTHNFLCTVMAAGREAQHSLSPLRHHFIPTESSDSDFDSRTRTYVCLVVLLTLQSQFSSMSSKFPRLLEINHIGLDQRVLPSPPYQKVFGILVDCAKEWPPHVHLISRELEASRSQQSSGIVPGSPCQHPGSLTNLLPKISRRQPSLTS